MCVHVGVGECVNVSVCVCACVRVCGVGWGGGVVVVCRAVGHLVDDDEQVLVMRLLARLATQGVLQRQQLQATVKRWQGMGVGHGGMRVGVGARAGVHQRRVATEILEGHDLSVL